MSTLNVDKVDPSSGTTLELGTSGDTINIPSGVTIANSGTATGFGAVLTGSTDNQVTTVTAANAFQGETNLTYNGTILGCGATGAAADLGVGLHVRTSDSSASVASGADELVLENSASGGMTILSGTSGNGIINFGDSGDNDIGQIYYSHSDNSMHFYANAASALEITSAGLGKSEFTALVWLNYNGSANSINDSHNVSSVGDWGTGNFGIYINAGLANANYMAAAMGQDERYISINTANTIPTTARLDFEVRSDAGTSYDVDRNCVVVFGTQ
tara:strand:+ start:80 stop:898 length:819 start_codon:yes stop_codon:yes gene_type:complete